MAIRILHTGDLHIGSFPGPERNGENMRYRDICKCLDAIVDKARDQRPDIAVIAGDIFHQAKVWSDRGLKEQQTAVEFFRRLSDICLVVVMRGTPNHDSAAQFSTLESTFASDDSVHIITEPGVGTYHSYDGKAVQIACLPGFDRGYYRAQHPGLSAEEENEVFTKSIEDMIIGLKAQCSAGSPTVFVSHFTITGANMEGGQTAFFSQLEPVVHPATLTAADFDLVCFGHIHCPQQLEGCKNTFYCGAISQLNFNDEGQARGFYIHDIEDDGEVKSIFFPLPTREHLTIWLDDEDVGEIASNGPEWLYKAPAIYCEDGEKEKIVRVLYDCTDEHNKAFNHAILEKWLYSCGVFWVQEIAPQEITITVNRHGMDADSTPEGNLVDYLTDKEIKPERISEIIQLARPIIAEATETASQERRTGLFVPVGIEVQNYRNYREEKFSFDPICFCTINGSNGVGKSSLFMDAILDALFEQPREGDLTGWIRSDPDARSGMIKFTFQLGERLYRVTRTRQKSGKATLNISEFVDGEWENRSKEKIRDTQQEIENILGMDSLTLKACALIMQDQYGLFLQADKEARMNILGNILGLGIYNDMEELAADRATETNRAIRTLSDRAETITAGLPDLDELAGQIDEADSRRRGFEADARQTAAEVDALKVSLNTQIEAAERIIRLNSRITALTAQISGKESAKTSQLGIITAADTILAGEAEIAAGIARYNTLIEQERELIKGKAIHYNLTKRKKQLEDAIGQAEGVAKSFREKEAALTFAKIEPLQQALSCEPELAGKHAEYLQIVARIAELEALLPDYEAKRAAAQGAQAEIERIDSEHDSARERLILRLDNLKKRIGLLDDSGCPDVEGARCRFLADALEAKKTLPDAEAALASLETEYEDIRQNASERLKTAQEDLDRALYHPEEMDTLLANKQRLEVAEREYNSLDGKRGELQMAKERAEEYKKSAADAEATSGDCWAELEGIKGQIAEAAQASADYGRIQEEIAVARQWAEKEKKLPVAREQKATAAQRIIELSTEIQTMEGEISDARAELEHEQAKTIGREALQAQVDAAEERIKMAQAAAQRESVMIGGLKKQIEQAEQKFCEAAEIQSQINALSGKAAGYEELKKAFSQDGIPHNVIRSIIPIFEATATNILGQMSQGHMGVEIVTEKTLKSNSKKEVTTLDIIINDSNTGRLPYMSRSGGERVKAALSIILALSEIKSSKAGVQFGFLFIDEPPFLDAAGVQAYCDALEAIRQRYSSLKVMAITHDETFKARFPQSVTVYKDEDGSHVRSD